MNKRGDRTKNKSIIDNERVEEKKKELGIKSRNLSFRSTRLSSIDFTFPIVKSEPNQDRVL